jgi:hypothetical protein
MDKPQAVMETSFWVLGHRVDVLPYLFRFFSVYVPTAVREEVLAPDPRYPQRVYGYQEMFRLLDGQGSLLMRNPTSHCRSFMRAKRRLWRWLWKRIGGCSSMSNGY